MCHDSHPDGRIVSCTTSVGRSTGGPWKPFLVASYCTEGGRRQMFLQGGFKLTQATFSAVGGHPKGRSVALGSEGNR